MLPRAAPPLQLMALKAYAKIIGWSTSALAAISVSAMVVPCGPSVCASPICARN
jgi:hypothetical protein